MANIELTSDITKHPYFGYWCDIVVIFDGKEVHNEVAFTLTKFGANMRINYYKKLCNNFEKRNKNVFKF